MSVSDSKKQKTAIWIIIGISFIVVCGLWIANYLILVNNADRGTIGDMYGVVGSLFSGLAFVGIIITIYLQSKELKLQREELQQTREEFKTQNATLKLQRFENTFFNMLSLHHDIVNGIDYETREFIADDPEMPPEAQNVKKISMKHTGRDVFQKNFESLRRRMKRCNNMSDINSEYMGLYWTFQSDFDHYFRNLYRIIKLVDTTQLTVDKTEEMEFLEKYKYVSIIRAQLSAYELLWLFYNCLSENGNEKFKPLIEKYTLFKSFRFEELAKQDHKELYEISAFEKQE